MIASVPVPQPMSRTRCPGVIAATLTRRRLKKRSPVRSATVSYTGVNQSAPSAGTNRSSEDSIAALLQFRYGALGRAGQLGASVGVSETPHAWHEPSGRARIAKIVISVHGREIRFLDAPHVHLERCDERDDGEQR